MGLTILPQNLQQHCIFFYLYGLDISWLDVFTYTSLLHHYGLDQHKVVWIFPQWLDMTLYKTCNGKNSYDTFQI